MSKKLFFTVPVLVLLLTAVVATSVFAQVTLRGLRSGIDRPRSIRT